MPEPENFWPADHNTLQRGITPSGRHWITGKSVGPEGGFFIAVHDPTTEDEDNRYFRAAVKSQIELSALVKKYVQNDSDDGIEDLPPVPVGDDLDG